MTMPGDNALSSQVPPLDAANEEFDATRRESRELSIADTGGWDPYEVWRTRVKSVRVQPADDEQP
jgi:hypothetical protein